MKLTEDVLTFSPVPIASPTESVWYDVAVRKRVEREARLSGWISKDEQDLLVRIRNDTKNVRSVPTSSGILSRKELEITEVDIGELLRRLMEGLWSAQDVLKAFCRRSTIAHHLTNPITEVNFDGALLRAKELDEYLAENASPIGPLHGLPLSVKDLFDIEGLDTTIGYAAWAHQPKNSKTQLLQKMHEAGAILFVKTNVPQTLMSGECVNYLFGRTSTPFNTSLSAGGSSGGEGSLISLGGSPLGIGTDIGSIRTPANFNGIFGLCPSSSRFPCKGASKTSGQEAIISVAGPLSRSIKGLELYTKTILGFEPWKWDPTIIDLPWRQELYDIGCGKQGPLCFGMMRHDSVVTPDPPIKRSLEDVKRKLQAAGHQVIEWEPISTPELEEILFKLLYCDGGEGIRQTIDLYNEPIIQEIDLPDDSWKLSVAEFWCWNSKKNALRQRYLEAWQATSKRTTSGKPIDGLIMPSGGHVAPPHGSMTYLVYEAVSNVLDWTCATIPVGFVDNKIDKPYSEFSPMSRFDEENRRKYTPEAYEGAPVALQLMGQRLSEEKVLGMLQSMNAALGRHPSYQA